MTQHKTNKDLLDALHEAAGREMTQEEVRQQRISFVLDMIDTTNDMTRANVAELIDNREGKVV
ncbi:MAG: hypothetical protein OXC62_04695 [Aestuariivita sp.]|nr:hypothetical protein [Aestuariivita sp.]